MEFRKITIFEKYKIEPNIEKTKLKSMFQTDPQKRKDLPVIIKIISSDNMLYEEELFTIHNDKELELHSKLEKYFEKSLEQNIGKNYKEISQIIITILKDEEYFKKFFYAKHLKEEIAKKIFNEYMDCIINKMQTEFIRTIGIESDETLKLMYNSISSIYKSDEKYNERKKDFDEDICDYLNNILTLDSTGKELILRLKSLLYLNKTIKNEYYNNSLKYIITKMKKDMKKYENILIEIYDSISKSFQLKDLIEISSYLQTIIHSNLNLRGELEGKKLKSAFKKLTKMQKCCLSYDNALGNKEKDKDYEDSEELLDFVVFSGYKWLEEYGKKIRQVLDESTTENMYDLIKHIVYKIPSKNVLRMYGNLILNTSTFSLEFDYIINSHEATVTKRSDKYVDPFEVDKFIAKYYWLVYVMEENYKTIFNNIQNIGFDILNISEKYIPLLNDRSISYSVKQEYRRLALMAYNALPGDWKIDGNQTVAEFIYSTDSIFMGKYGEAETYKKHYEELFDDLNYDRRKIKNCKKCNYRISEESTTCEKCGEKIKQSEEMNKIKPIYTNRSNEIKKGRNIIKSDDYKETVKGEIKKPIFVPFLIIYIILWLIILIMIQMYY